MPRRYCKWNMATLLHRMRIRKQVLECSYLRLRDCRARQQKLRQGAKEGHYSGTGTVTIPTTGVLASMRQPALRISDTCR